MFGLYPALHASRPDVQAALNDQSGQSTASRSTGIFRSSLVTMQIAMSFLLLITAALFAKTLVNLTRTDLGLTHDHLVTFSLDPRLNGYTAVLGSIRQEVAALDANLPIRNLRSMEAHLESRMAAERLLSLLTGSFGGLATLLAAIGLYGLLAYSLQRRTREIGIRVALGARNGDVRRLVLREVAVMLVVGVILGGAASAGIGQLMRGVLFGVEPLDPAVYAGAVATITGVALLAGYVPARRATAVDPLVTLRHE